MKLYFIPFACSLATRIAIEVRRDDDVLRVSVSDNGKGLRERSVIVTHVLRNALLPVVTLARILAAAALVRPAARSSPGRGRGESGHADRLDQLIEVAEGLQDQDVDAGAFPAPEQSLDLLA